MTWRHLRIGFVLAGMALIGLAWFGDTIRGRDADFGALQAAALLIGGLLVLTGSAGSKVPLVWRGIAVMALNALVLFLALDIAAWYVLTLLPRERYAGRMHLAYYEQQPWTLQYRQEFAAVNDAFRFAPYVLWEGQPAPGRYVSVDSAGRRTTPGARCDSAAYVVAALGGSTLWGVGAPDSATIPAFLQRELASRTSRHICVRNLGERAYVTTQELIRLELELQRGRVPDLVIFYDGINDVIMTWRYDDAGLHNGVDRIGRRLQREPGWDEFLDKVHLVRLLRALDERRLSRRPGPAPVRNADSLGGVVADIWSANCRMATALGIRYGFATACFLQPVMPVGAKPLTAEERSSLELMPASEQALFRATYQRIRANPPSDARFVDLSGVFDAESAQTYIDWFHVLPLANETVARQMVAALDRVPGFPGAGGRAAGGNRRP